MGWQVGESWLETDVLWFRETAVVSIPVQRVSPMLTLPESFELPLRARPVDRRQMSRRFPALALVLGSAVVLPLAGQRTGAPLESLRALWEDPPSQTLRLGPQELDASTELAARAAAFTGLGIATSTKAFARRADPESLIDWHQATSRGLPFSGSLLHGTQLPIIGPDWVTWNPATDSSPNLPRRLYGNELTIHALVSVITAYRATHREAPRVVVGDISFRSGGRMDEHASHQNGLDVDVYYPRRDRLLRAPRTTAQIDRRLAQDLVDRFLAAGARIIFVGYSTGLDGPRGVVVPYPNHENHMHVRFPHRPRAPIRDVSRAPLGARLRIRGKEHERADRPRGRGARCRLRSKTFRRGRARSTKAAPWGFHLLLDLEACDLDSVRSADTIRGFAQDLVDAIDMRAYGEPILAHFAEHKPEAAGWSLVQLIETSNITGHFCDLTGDAYLDVFSCKPFDADVAIAVAERWFAPCRVTQSLIARQA